MKVSTIESGMKCLKITITVILILNVNSLIAQFNWENPIRKQGRLGSPLVETSPFVFEDKLYLLENNQRFWEVPGAKPGEYFHKDEVRIRDVISNKIISVPLKNHGFGTVLTWNGCIYVFAGNYGKGKPWRQITEITMTSSKDLKNWTKPITVLKASDDEFFFNTAVCKGKDKFILLYETNDSHWVPFTFRYVQSTDLIHWEEIPNAVYGKEKYVGGPALYYEGGWYYTLYLESLKKGFETRITRSKDLINWEDAREDRPFITFDPTKRYIPLLDPKVSESNASDVELCFYMNKTILYFTGSDQTTAGDLQWAICEGTPSQLFEHFFQDTGEQTIIVPKHEGNWAPVLIAPKTNQESQVIHPSEVSDKPSPQQLAYQERQLGAFIHFGPATWLNSDMLAVPDASLFNPTKLDAEQWVKTAKSIDAKHVVLTAKHHNGYCLWPTKTTDYSVKQSPWENGQGDVVDDFVKACRKYDIKIGLYLSGGDNHFACTSTPDPQGERKLVGDIDKYFPVFLEQLRELLTNYGEIDYLWFDGAYDPFGWDVMNEKTMEPLGTAYGDAIRAMVKHLQPNAVVMGTTKSDIRWSGSELGWASYPLWNVVKPDDWMANWVGPQNAGWIPAEANIYTRKSWFWTPNSDNTLRNIPFLKNVYYESIGRGANLLINITPDTCGLIPEAEIQLLSDFGKAIDHIFSNPLTSEDYSDKGTVNEIIINLPKRQSVNLLVMEEDIRYGQSIEKYKVEAFNHNRWEAVVEGQSIGRKRIERFDAVATEKLRISLIGKKDKMHMKRVVAYLNTFKNKD